jgi:predicted permease
MLNGVFQDLRYGARMLLKRPGFTLVAVVTLALGIGANTAIFSVVNAVLLRPLPYPDPERLLVIDQQYPRELAGAGEPKFLFWREHSQSFEALAAYSSYGDAGGNLSGGDEAEFVRGLRVSEDFFRVLGVSPAHGRAFTSDEDKPGGDRVAILSYELWRRRFGENPGVVGQTVLLNGKGINIVGVMPRGFRHGFNTDLYVPMQARPDANHDPNATAVGRLRPGVTIEQARAELKTIADQFRAAFPGHMQDGESLTARPYKDELTEGLPTVLVPLLGAVGFLLLIACANVANLQLTRGAARGREIAVRMALGAPGGRILRQLLTEGLLLALVGGLAGLLIAAWGAELLVAAMPQGLLPSVAVVSVDWRVLAFALAAAVATGLLSGLAPVWQARKIDISTALKEQAGRGGAARTRLRGTLVVVEVALSVVMLVGAGLLVRTFANLLAVEPGFDPRNIVTCRVALNGDRYKAAGNAAAFYNDALERIKGLPGVEGAAITNKLPLDWQFNMPVVFPWDPDRVRSVQMRVISPDYFEVMKIDVQQGRAFDSGDNAGGAPVALVNQAFVDRYFEGRDAMSMQLSVGRGTGDPMRQIVGVVRDSKQQGLDRPAPATVFVPLEQVHDKLMAVVRTYTAVHFVVRSAAAPSSITAEIKRQIAALDPTLALSEIQSMEEIAARSIATQRFNMMIVGLFAALGVVLAAVGIYGVTSYTVAQRTPEIGLRIALGAQAHNVVRLVLRQGLGVTLLGTAIGLAGAYGVTRLIKSLLFGVSETDPLTFGLIGLLLITVALAACYLPARRATRVDPMVALRYE